MSEGFSNPIIGGGGALEYPAIMSPNFSAGPPLVGWSIDKNGDAFFANLTLAGLFMGTDWEMNSSGLFFYNGTPAAGNPPIMWAVPTGVTQDRFGNPVAAALGAGDHATSSAGFASDGGLHTTDQSATDRIIRYTGTAAHNPQDVYYDYQDNPWITVNTGSSGAGDTPRTLFQNVHGAVVCQIDWGTGGIFFYQDLASASQGNLIGAFTIKASVTDRVNSQSLAVAGFTGSIVAQHPGAQTQETLQTPTTTGFTTFAGTQQVKYEMTPDGYVEITGVMETTGAYTAGTAIWTMPAGYRPATNSAAIEVVQDTGGSLSINQANISTAGVVSLALNVPNTTLITFSGGHYRIAA